MPILRYASSIPLAALLLATAPGNETVHADTEVNFNFQTPSHNIACYLATTDREGRVGSVACEIGDRSYAAPPRPPSCHLGWGDRFVLNQGDPPTVSCHGDTLLTGDLPTLDYGEGAFTGAIRCQINEHG